jgi:hypothetical protein
MSFVYPNLCKELDYAGITTSCLAEKLNISEYALRSKLSGNTEWTLTEAINICKILKNTDVHFLFLQLDNN